MPALERWVFTKQQKLKITNWNGMLLMTASERSLHHKKREACTATINNVPKKQDCQ